MRAIFRAIRPSRRPDGTAPFASLVIATLRAWEGGGAGAALVVLRARMTEAQAGAAMAALCDLAGLLCASRRRPSAATWRTRPRRRRGGFCPLRARRPRWASARSR